MQSACRAGNSLDHLGLSEMHHFYEFLGLDSDSDHPRNQLFFVSLPRYPENFHQNLF